MAEKFGVTKNHIYRILSGHRKTPSAADFVAALDPKDETTVKIIGPPLQQINKAVRWDFGRMAVDEGFYVEHLNAPRKLTSLANHHHRGVKLSVHKTVSGKYLVVRIK